MKRIYVTGLTWPLANQPCLLLSTDSSDFIISFPCDPAEVTLFFRIARREVQSNMPLVVSATAKFLAQTYLSITSIELLERRELCDRAMVNVLTNDSTIKKIEMSCMEAIAMALIFDRPIFAAETLLQPLENVVPELAKEKKEQEAREIATFIKNVNASDFSKYADSKQLGI